MCAKGDGVAVQRTGVWPSVLPISLSCVRIRSALMIIAAISYGLCLASTMVVLGSVLEHRCQILHSLLAPTAVSATCSNVRMALSATSTRYVCILVWVKLLILLTSNIPMLPFSSPLHISFLSIAKCCGVLQGMSIHKKKKKSFYELNFI